MKEIMVNTRTYLMKYKHDLYCPFCGQKEIRQDVSEGDYHEGSILYCEYCKKDFFLFKLKGEIK